MRLPSAVLAEYRRMEQKVGRGVEWICGVDGAILNDDGGDGPPTDIRVPEEWSGWSGFILKTSEKKGRK